MEKYLILGFAEYSGEYEGKAYSGMRVYVQRFDVEVKAGIATDVIKIKSTLLPSIPIAWTEDIVGCVLLVGYNRYGQVSTAELQQEGK